jgi:hypothetical protein
MAAPIFSSETCFLKRSLTSEAKARRLCERLAARLKRLRKNSVVSMASAAEAGLETKPLPQR